MPGAAKKSETGKRPVGNGGWAAARRPWGFSATARGSAAGDSEGNGGAAGTERELPLQRLSGVFGPRSHRKLARSGKDEARIDACADLATLERWLDQAIDAKGAAEALR